MAQKVQIVLEDDLDGGEATETLTFGLDGTSYEIDLNDQNAAALRESLATYVGHGRKVTPGRKARKAGSAGGTTSAVGGASPREVRAWARDQGYDVPDRGRIPAAVREAYDAAH